MKRACLAKAKKWWRCSMNCEGSTWSWRASVSVLMFKTVFVSRCHDGNWMRHHSSFTERKHHLTLSCKVKYECSHFLHCLFSWFYLEFFTQLPFFSVLFSFSEFAIFRCVLASLKDVKLVLRLIDASVGWLVNPSVRCLVDPTVLRASHYQSYQKNNKSPKGIKEVSGTLALP